MSESLEEIVAKLQDPAEIDAWLEQLDRIDEEDSLYKFTRGAWSSIDPAPWSDGWPAEALAEHLEAVVDGQIKRLCINVPPRSLKSSMTSVAFPAFVWAQPEKRWGPLSGPHVQFLSSSYSHRLALRDSVKSRRLIQSPWYQRKWGNRFRLNPDQNAKQRYGNDKGGERLITSVDSGTTGEGGMIILLDDPNDASDVSSETALQNVIDWWDGTMQTRLNSPKDGAFIIIQQRLAEDDLTGHVLSKDEGDWCHLMIPMFYEPERSYYTAINWKDPRTTAGELMWPDRFGEKEARDLERRLGPWRAAGQLQQRPEPDGGGVIKRDWWSLWEHDDYPPMDFVMASLDTAYTTKEINDACALTVWGVFHGSAEVQANRILGPDGRPVDLRSGYLQGAPKVLMMYAWNKRLELNELVHEVAKTCRRFGVDQLVIENKAAGISCAQELRRLYGNENWSVLLSDPRGQDKLARLYSVQHLFAETQIIQGKEVVVPSGIIYAPDKVWADEVISQVAQFPAGKHDDLVDTVSQALKKLREMGLLARAQERIDELDSLRSHRGRPPEPLYPG